MSTTEMLKAALERVLEVGNDAACEVAVTALAEYRRLQGIAPNYRNSDFLQAIVKARPMGLSVDELHGLWRHWGALAPYKSRQDKPALDSPKAIADWLLSAQIIDLNKGRGRHVRTKVMRVYETALEMTDQSGDWIFSELTPEGLRA